MKETFESADIPVVNSAASPLHAWFVKTHPSEDRMLLSTNSKDSIESTTLAEAGIATNKGNKRKATKITETLF